MKYAIFLTSFLIANIMFSIINFYQAKHIIPTVWNLLKYNIYLLPVYFIVNFIITFTLNKAFGAIGKMWPAIIMYWGTALVASVIFSFVFFKEIPKNNVLVGLILTISGIVIANYK